MSEGTFMKISSDITKNKDLPPIFSLVFQVQSLEMFYFLSQFGFRLG